MCFYRVSHSKNAIVKPASKSSDKDRKDIDKAMRRVKEASSIIEDEIDPGMLSAIIHFYAEHPIPALEQLFSFTCITFQGPPPPQPFLRDWA